MKFMQKFKQLLKRQPDPILEYKTSLRKPTHRCKICGKSCYHAHFMAGQLEHLCYQCHEQAHYLDQKRAYQRFLSLHGYKHKMEQKKKPEPFIFR